MADRGLETCSRVSINVTMFVILIIDRSQRVPDNWLDVHDKLARLPSPSLSGQR